MTSHRENLVADESREQLVARLRESGRWMLRFSNNGRSYNGGFQWSPLGEWTEAPDWNPKPVCGGGLHGQGPGGFGDSPTTGSHLDLCETEELVVIGGKVKTPRARIVAHDNVAIEIAQDLCGGKWPGGLDCSGYAHDLPSLTHVGGSLDCEGYAHALLSLSHVGGDLYCKGYAYDLPSLSHVGGWLDCKGYAHEAELRKRIGDKP